MYAASLSLVPLFHSPNLITLVGLLLQVAALVVVFHYNPVFSTAGALAPNMPSWVCYFAAMCLFSYQTLDNMDGKQARRIGASSPLGLLFDHGCDAINTGMVGSLVGALVVGANLQQTYVIWTVAITAFFMNTWEEYVVWKRRKGALLLLLLLPRLEGGAGC